MTFTSAHADAVSARIDCLTPDASRKWGKMDAPQMVAHLIDSLQALFGEKPFPEADDPVIKSRFKQTLMRWLILYVPMPMPKGSIETFESMRERKPGDWDADIAELKRLVRKLVDGPAAGTTWPQSPIAGRMSVRQWQTLNRKHLNHHLRQFGV